MVQLPIHIITLYHPDSYLGIPASQLSSLPAIKKDRESVEARRIEAARSLEVPVVMDEFHGRLISNTGKPVYRFRDKSVKAVDLLPCLSDFEVRMIDTVETGSQARYKIEFRPTWADFPNPLGSDIVESLLQGMQKKQRMWVRQLWRNPTNARFGDLPLEVAPSIAPETANLVLGPFDAKFDTGAATMRFTKFGKVWWLSY